MARKRYDDSVENHERWLISYADFITLLFAFFVVMYAISVVNDGKYKVLSDALGDAFGGRAGQETRANGTVEPLPLTSLLQRKRAESAKRERERLATLARDLGNTLAPLIKAGKVRVTQSGRGVSIEINASVLFDSGDAALTGESKEALRAVAQLLKDDTHAIRVEGHTDNVPISNARYPSNWELSAVRASSVVRLFIEGGVAEGRLTAVGNGANQPVAPNNDDAGRSRNRRVAIMILSALPDGAAEVPAR
ncbi:flagellar motor protein MotD [Massilia horti]|uniref:Flagellar motor protein MotD n=1 Tax=Massilia horti TaxID=2562153 RepID=A0A4Y9T035_9BURK|nr:flagellar motor protein MotD [Massilia horti]TFW32066.1 flagellar motor protein MotD [Massilia horti]